MDVAYRKIFGQGLWIIIGSLVAFLVGQILDVAVYQRIKKSTGEKLLWLRATGSTLVSQFVDSFVVLIIAFYIGADWELGRVLAIGLFMMISILMKSSQEERQYKQMYWLEITVIYSYLT